MSATAWPRHKQIVVHTPAVFVHNTITHNVDTIKSRKQFFRRLCSVGLGLRIFAIYAPLLTEALLMGKHLLSHEIYCSHLNETEL